MSEWIKAFKGFNRDLSCAPDGGEKFQYEEGKEYDTEDAKECKCGFHACEYPLDVFYYYAPGQSVFHEVELGGKLDKGDCKIAATKIRIGASINIAGMVKAAIEYTNAKIKDKKQNTGFYGASSNTGNRGASSNTGNYGASSNTGDYGASSNTGDYGASSNTGDYGASSNTGDRGASSNTGYRGASSNTGNYGASSNTGDYGASSNTGYRGASSNTGDYGASSNTGDCGASSNTGYRGIAEAGHPNSVAVAWGPECKAKGVRGSFLVLAEWISNGGNHWNKDTWTFAGSQMVRVDGEHIKENTLYWLHDGKVTEWKEEE